MQLTDFLNGFKILSVTGEVQRKDVSSITYDSRMVQPNSVFAAIKGFTQDGHKYINEAISKGAIAVIVEDANTLPDEIYIHSKTAKIVVRDSRKALAVAANHLYKNPSEKLKLSAVTGTNGKTTSTYILRRIFETAGSLCGLLGTIEIHNGREKINAKLTTPESSDVAKYLYDMLESGCSYAVMEASSHALYMSRLHGLKFRSAIFTNLSQDHLDFHETMNGYFNAKKILFDSVDAECFVVYNLDDEFGESIVADSPGIKVSFGKNPAADYRIENIVCSLEGTKFTITHNNVTYAISTPLRGEFNAYNVTGSFAAAHKQGIASDVILKAINGPIQVPGRFEVYTAGTKKIVIDYAHTPDSLEKTIRNIKDIAPGEKLTTVFGCGGDRDRGKRPIMGEIASRLSDFVVLTTDNPRTENPAQIMDDITAGISGSNYSIVEDRRAAIREAINNAGENSVVLIAGKGHEDYQVIGKERVHFSDREEVLKVLNNAGK